MAQKRGRRAHPANPERVAALQKYVDQNLTLAQIGVQMGISGERARQLITQLGIKGANRKRGRRPKPVVSTLAELDVKKLEVAYFGDTKTGASPLPLNRIAKEFNVSTNRLRRLVKHLKWGKRGAIPRPKRKTPLKYDRELIYDLCVNQRMSDQSIADYLRKKLGVKAYASYVNLLRKKWNISRPPLAASERKNAKNDLVEKVEKCLRGGMSPKEAAAECNCSNSYVYRLINKNGWSELLPRHKS